MMIAARVTMLTPKVLFIIVSYRISFFSFGSRLS